MEKKSNKKENTQSPHYNPNSHNDQNNPNNKTGGNNYNNKTGGDKKRKTFGVNLFYILPLGFLLLFGLLAFAGKKSGGTSHKPADTLMLSLSGDPVSLNPVLASETLSMTVNALIFNGLVRYNEKLEIEPELAEQWEISSDEKSVTFYLKKGIKWHDGQELTAEDVAFTYDKVLDETTNTYNRGLFLVNGEPIKFFLIDKYTVRAELPRPFAPFLNNLTLVGIVPKHLLEKDDINKSLFNTHPVGTGAFRFQEWKASDQIVLTANEDYFKGKPKLNKIIYRIIPSGEGSRIALFTGQIDMAGLSAEDLFVTRKIPQHLNLYRWADFTYMYLAFDLTNPLFSHREVRKALNYGVDTQTLIQSTVHGIGSAVYSPLPRASWAHSDHVEKYPFNPEKARKILWDKGWQPGKDGILEKDGKKFSFTVLIPSGSRSCESSAVFIQDYLQDLGIEMKIQPLDKTALINSLYPQKFEACIFNWVEPFDPDIFTEWHSSQFEDGMNFMSYANPKADELLEKARYTFDREERKEYYHQLQRVIVDDAPYIWLWNQETVLGVDKRVKGLSPPSPAGLLLNPEQVYIEEVK